MEQISTLVFQEALSSQARPEPNLGLESKNGWDIRSTDKCSSIIWFPESHGSCPEPPLKIHIKILIPGPGHDNSLGVGCGSEICIFNKYPKWVWYR